MLLDSKKFEKHYSIKEPIFQYNNKIILTFILKIRQRRKNINLCSQQKGHKASHS